MRTALIGAVVILLTWPLVAKKRITEVPKECVRVDRFYKPCEPEKFGGWHCDVHLSIKAEVPECLQYDHQRVIEVPR